MSTDSVGGGKPKIRLHRYEQILAVKWPGDEHWLKIWPKSGHFTRLHTPRPLPPMSVPLFPAGRDLLPDQERVLGPRHPATPTP